MLSNSKRVRKGKWGDSMRMTARGFAALLLLTAAGACVAGSAQGATNKVAKAYGPPGKFEDQIKAFEAADQKAFPPAGAVLCIGSSSMRMWHPTIKEDLAPLTVIPRGFGGSTMSELLHAADRIVIPYKPRAIVVYEGDYDIASGIAPETVRDTFLAFERKVRAALPEVRIYVIAVKPSIKRQKLWPQMTVANRLLAEACRQGQLMTFIDVAAPMLDADGKPRKELFVKDDLHMTRAGYEVWRDTVRPVLHKSELAFESKR